MPPVRLRVCGREIMMSDEGGCNNDDAIWPTDRRKAAKFNWINPSISPRRPSRFRSVSVSPSPFFYAALDCVCSYVRRRRSSVFPLATGKLVRPLVRSPFLSVRRPSNGTVAFAVAREAGRCASNRRASHLPSASSSTDEAFRQT